MSEKHPLRSPKIANKNLSLINFKHHETFKAFDVQRFRLFLENNSRRSESTSVYTVMNI